MRKQLLSRTIIVTLTVLPLVLITDWVHAADRAPEWMQALKSASVPAHRDKDDAVCMYSEESLTVNQKGKLVRRVRAAYKILRVDSPHSVVRVPFDDQTKVTDVRAWSIPVAGKDYAVKQSDAYVVDASERGLLVTDNKLMALRVPGADPGALVGYEFEQEERPYFLEDQWIPQQSVTVREAHYVLQLPQGWTFKTIWQNSNAVEAVKITDNRWEWVLRDLKGIKEEQSMPSLPALAQHMSVRVIPSSGQANTVDSWGGLGNWLDVLNRDRRSSSPEIKQSVVTLTSGQSSILDKIKALARFSQSDIRYVAIELGIGGQQSHFAKDIFSNRYGDCKDKSTLLATMLNEIGVQSYYVVVNTDHSVVSENTAPTLMFNHAIIAIKLPGGIADSSLLSIINHPKLGNLLIFDPTNDLIPLGQLPGYLQGNHALLVRTDGSELLKLPVQSTATSGVNRIAKLAISEKGMLSGNVTSNFLGYSSFEMRQRFQHLTTDLERQKDLSGGLADSFASFKVVDFKLDNLPDIFKPFELHYTFEAEKYAKLTGDMLIIRPRILGSKSSSLLETEEKRENPVQFVSLQKDSDEFVVTLPAGYVADDLPPPTDLDYPFGSYHSKTSVTGNILKYARTFEIKQFTVPVDKLDDLKSFYRQIYRDERANAVLVKK